MENTIGYCVKCKAKREMKDPVEVVINRKNGSKGRAMKGTCPVCGTKMFRFLSSKKQEDAS